MVLGYCTPHQGSCLRTGHRSQQPADLRRPVPLFRRARLECWGWGWCILAPRSGCPVCPLGAPTQNEGRLPKLFPSLEFLILKKMSFHDQEQV